jgi:hypothetical protein
LASGNCPTIQIYPEQITLFADNGRIFLDVSEATTFALSKELANSSGLLDIQSEREISLTLPRSDKNFFYLKHLFDSQVSKTINHIICRITTGSTTHYFSKLYASEKDSGEIQILLKYEPDWIGLLKQTKLKDIDLPTFDFTLEHIVSLWEDDGIYNDGDVGYWFPVVYYGGWRVPNRRLVVEDLRPLIHATFLLQKMFEYIGWCIEAPFYETPFGRRLITYLLKDDYSNNDELNKRRHVYTIKRYPVGTTLGQLMAGFILNWNSEDDVYNNWNRITGRYEKPFEGSFKITLAFGSESGETGGQVAIFRAYKTSTFSGVNYADIIFSQEITITGQSEVTLSIPVNILADEYVIFSLSAVHTFPNDEELPFSAEIHMWAKSTRTFYVKGDVIDLKKEVDQELSCYDVFEGLQHLIYGIAEEDYSSRTIRLLTPHDADVFGTTIDGYFIDDVINLTDQQPAHTTKSILNTSQRERYINIGFKKSSDPYLKDKKRIDGLPLFSKTIDTGDTTNTETKEDLNPLFEGTTQALETLYGDYLNKKANYTVLFPVMADNKDEKVSYKIAPRIIYAGGYRTYGISQVLYNFERAFQSALAMAWQEPGAIKIIFDTPDERLVYGDEEFDLWRMVYANFYLQYNQRQILDVLANFTHNQYDLSTLNKNYIVEYDGHPVTGRLQRINDFNPCSALTAQVILLPDLPLGAICIASPTPNQCLNTASIIHTSDCDCNNFSIVGTFECNVTSIEWNYRNEDTSNEWTEIPDSADTAQLCGLILDTYIQARIIFDCPDCPDLYVSLFINPCEININCDLIQYNNAIGQTCIQWGFNINTTCGYTIESVEVNGETLPFPYLLCGVQPNTLYEFIAIFSFENGCADQTLICSIIPNQNPCANYPSLQCSPVGDNCYEFIITGNLSTPIETYIVTYECNGQIGTWMQGDPPICCSSDFTAHAMVFFCGCDPVCTQTITCVGSGCTIYNPGTPIMLAVCN